MAYFSVTTFQNLLLLFKNLCTISEKAINKEPTHPQAGTKIHIQTYSCRTIQEPTHPQAGTKTSPFRDNTFQSLGTNPSPLGDENVTVIVLLTTLALNQPIPTRGRKYRGNINKQSITTNQPIPKRGRKSGHKMYILRGLNRNQPIPKRGRKKLFSGTVLD